MLYSPAVYLGSIRTESAPLSKPRAKPLPVRQDRDSGARRLCFRARSNASNAQEAQLDNLHPRWMPARHACQPPEG